MAQFKLVHFDKNNKKFSSLDWADLMQDMPWKGTCNETMNET
jgi:hypothetical protein